MASKMNAQRGPVKKAAKGKADKGEKTTAVDTVAVQPSAPAAAPVAVPAAATSENPKAERRMSALDAAAAVLAETGQPLSCPQLIAAMAAKGYWSSPKGKTPAATLYSAMAREAKTKGVASRFRKVGRGQFARNGVA